MDAEIENLLQCASAYAEASNAYEDALASDLPKPKLQLLKERMDDALCNLTGAALSYAGAEKLSTNEAGRSCWTW